ncbi:MAG TPA: NACHT domain-containing protein, partial [Nitrosomonas sp.]|nr:NACHT domain-containing protein [Nitrosomonas sp.]
TSEPLASRSSLRGLLPFEDGDDLPGRSRDIQSLYTLITSKNYRFGVLWGESGCGKTSFLRAGLGPKLRSEGYLPLYINKPTTNPVDAVKNLLITEMGYTAKQSEKGINQLLKMTTSKNKRIIIIFDQFEEFFLTNHTQSSRSSFIKWVGEIIAATNLPVAFLISIRSDFFAQLQSFAPQIPEPTSTQTTYQLENFDIEQAKQIFKVAANIDGIAFNEELIQAVIRDLEVDDYIRPAELQVVGTRLKHKNIITINRYESLGGARGILSSYIKDEINRSVNEKAARLILRLMCAETVETKSPTDLRFEEILGNIYSVGEIADSRTAVQNILNQFVTARLIVHTDEDKYNLVHDYLAAYIKIATEGMETNTERANGLLRRYTASYRENRNVFIPYEHLRSIQKFASLDVKNKTTSQELVRRSWRLIFVQLAAVGLLFSLGISIYLFTRFGQSYVSIDRSRIVLRSGIPELVFMRGVGEVIVQTDYERNDLVNDVQVLDDIDQGRFAGYWLDDVNDKYGDYDTWGRIIVTRLETGHAAQMWRWLGYPEKAQILLLDGLIGDNKKYSNLDPRSAMIPLLETNPQLVTEQLIADQIGDALLPNAPANAVTVLEQIVQANPAAVTPDVVKPLLEIITSPSPDEMKSSTALSILARLVRVNPKIMDAAQMTKFA